MAANTSLNDLFSNIADSIRTKNGEPATTKYKPTQMATAIAAIKTLPTLQNKVVNPTESVQNVSFDSGYDGLNVVSVSAISNVYIGSGITRRSSSNLTVNGATVTAPAGYYASDATKNVNSISQAIPTLTLDTTTGIITGTSVQDAGYVTSGTKTNTLSLTTVSSSTISPTESVQVAVSANRYTLGDVKIGAISNTYVGSAINRNSSSNLSASGATVTVPAGYYSGQATKSVTTATQATPTISVSASGLITASCTQSAGYVTAGTKTNTNQLTTKAAATITPTTTNITIAANTYLTGTQTILGDADLIPGNIISGVNIFGVQGNVTFQNFYTGSSIPSSSLGNNGDLYFQG